MALLLKIHYFLAITCLILCATRAFPKEAGLEQDIILEQRLKILNKPAIKSIDLDYAIFDCVDIYMQPAFDHPLLKNHEIQMKPTDWYDKSNKVDKGHSTQKLRSITFDLHLDCPNGTVPIRRTTKEDLIKEKSSRGFRAHPLSNAKSNDHFAALEIHQGNRHRVTGAKGNIDIQNPQCNEGEVSGALIWLTTSVVEGITVGWMVDSRVYGNSNTYFEASWKGKGSGCINLRCPGFVQVSQSHPLGLLLTNVSKYGGPLYTLPLWIYQDNATKNWWLVTGTEQVGYWPKELFSTFAEGAKYLTYGGYVRENPNQHQQTSPPMGSGYTEKCAYDHTSFFSNLEYQITDEALKGIYITPRTRKTAKLRGEHCPNYVAFYSCKDSQELGYYFLYGGPRGICP